MITSINQRVQNLKIAIHHIWQSSPVWTIVNFMLLIIQGILPLLSLYLLKLIVDTAATFDSTAAVNDDVLKRVAFLILLSGVVAITVALLHSITKLVHSIQISLVSVHVYDILHAKCIEVDLASYENSHYHDKLHRAKKEGEGANRTFNVVNNLENISRNGISLLTMLVLLAFFHWALVLFLLLALFPSLLVYLKYSYQQYQLKYKRTSLERKCWYYSSVLTESKYAKEIRLFGLGSLFRGWFLRDMEKLRHEHIELAKKRSIAEMLTETGSAIAVFFAFAFIAYKTLSGIATLGDLVMYYLAFQRAQGYLKEVLGSLSRLYEDSLSLSGFHEFLDIKTKIKEPSVPKLIPQPLKKGISFENVSFTYPDGTRPVFEDLNITIRPGEHVAFVGENGSGKTTLVKLLCRLYDPGSGRITFDGIDIREIKMTDLRHQISVVFQDYAKYQLTAKENIWLGDIDSKLNENSIINAAQLSGIDKVIDRLPLGYETLLGRWFEGGEELSLGEWQKVALARAFARNAEILILDEPSSALDAKAESEVFNKYHQLTVGKTAILISHRLSTVKMVDNIYVIENGKIVESGSHNDLMKQRGKYAYLFNKQAKNYQ